VTDQEVNLLTPNALIYVVRQLASLTGITDADSDVSNFDAFSIPIHYCHPNKIPPKHPTLFVIPCAIDAWRKLLSLPNNTLDWLSQEWVLPPNVVLPFSDPIPILFWGAGYEDGHKPFAERLKDGTVIFYADIIAATLFMLTRWEETVTPERDEHDRFPATASVAYKQGFLDRPIVDEYALILRAWLQVLLPNWEPQQNRFSIKLSHDIDHLQSFPNYYSALRTLAHYTVKQPSPQRIVETLRETLVQTIAPTQTAYFKGVHMLMQLSHQFGLTNDAFYFMTAQPGRMENEYSVTFPIVKDLIKQVQSQGFEIGLHAGYNSANNPELLKEQRDLLATILGEIQFGGRQHYLRFRAPDTWRYWETAGLLYDATLGYADHEGFRSGTCHRYQPFDIEQDRQISIWEEPLIVMDGTLRSVRKMPPAQALNRIKELAQRCQWAEGTFTLLWHNSSLSGEWRPWLQTYWEILKHLGDLTS